LPWPTDLQLEALEDRCMPSTAAALPNVTLLQPVTFTAGAVERLDAILATTTVNTAALTPLLAQERPLFTQLAPTLSAAGQQELAKLLAQTDALFTQPALRAESVIRFASEFIDFLKDKPAFKIQLDALLNRVPVQSGFLVPFLSGLGGSPGGFTAQQQFVLTHPFVSARFMVLMAEEFAANFVDTGTVALSLTGVSEEIQTPREVNTFNLVAPQTGQLLVQMDPATGSEDNFGARLSVFDSAGRLLDATNAAGFGVVSLDVQAGQSYSVEVAGSEDRTGQYDLLFALAFGEPSLGAGRSAAGLLAQMIAAAEPRAPATGLLPLGESSFTLVATLLSTGVDSATTAETQPIATLAAKPSLSAENHGETPVSDSAGSPARLLAGLEEALAGQRPPARDESWDARSKGQSVDQQGMRDVRASPARQSGEPMALPRASELPAPASTPPGERSRTRGEPAEHETERPAQEVGPGRLPDEGDREAPRSWEASALVPVAIVAAWVHVVRQRTMTVPRDGEI
jgi:hypothetical protein